MPYLLKMIVTGIAMAGVAMGQTVKTAMMCDTTVKSMAMNNVGAFCARHLG